MLVGALSFFCSQIRPPAPEKKASALFTELGCGSPESDLSSLVDRFDGDRIFVTPLVWNALLYEQRIGLAGWYSVCRRSGSFVFIRHANTGKTLASFSPATGYSGEE
jgi:hypothetical protein